MRNWTEHGSSQLTAISDAGSTPAASTSLRPLRGLRFGKPAKPSDIDAAIPKKAKAVAPEIQRRRTSQYRHGFRACDHCVWSLSTKMLEPGNWLDIGDETIHNMRLMRKFIVEFGLLRSGKELAAKSEIS